MRRDNVIRKADKRDDIEHQHGNISMPEQDMAAQMRAEFQLRSPRTSSAGLPQRMREEYPGRGDEDLEVGEDSLGCVW
jgi:hypothetical protein